MRYLRNPLIIFIILNVSIALITSINKYQSMDYNIPISTLPQNLLWETEYAESLSREAFSFGTGDIVDEDKLLILLSQAWQGDKNAMLRYLIAKEEDIRISDSKGHIKTQLNIFIRKYRHQIKDYQGNIIEEPAFLRKNSPNDIMNKLISLEHPASMNYPLFGDHSDLSYIKTLSFSFPKESRERHTIGIERELKAGYRFYSVWADLLLWDTDSNANYSPGNLNSLKSINTLPSEEIQIKAVIEGYQPCALNGSFYCAIHMAEAYLYGIGVEQNDQTAYAWAMTVNKNYLPYLEKYQQKEALESKDIIELLTEVNNLALDIVQETERKMSPEQLISAKIQLDDLLKQIKYHYDEWFILRDKVPLMQ